MILLQIDDENGKEMLVEYFDSMDECKKRLSDEQAKKYWNERCKHLVLDKPEVKSDPRKPMFDAREYLAKFDPEKYDAAEAGELFGAIITAMGIK